VTFCRDRSNQDKRKARGRAREGRGRAANPTAALFAAQPKCFPLLARAPLLPSRRSDAPTNERAALFVCLALFGT